jgi:hypothetical protein
MELCRAEAIAMWPLTPSSLNGGIRRASSLRWGCNPAGAGGKNLQRATALDRSADGAFQADPAGDHQAFFECWRGQESCIAAVPVGRACSNSTGTDCRSQWILGLRLEAVGSGIVKAKVPRRGATIRSVSTHSTESNHFVDRPTLFRKPSSLLSTECPRRPLLPRGPFVFREKLLRLLRDNDLLTLAWALNIAVLTRVEAIWVA